MPNPCPTEFRADDNEDSGGAEPAPPFGGILGPLMESEPTKQDDEKPPYLRLARELTPDAIDDLLGKIFDEEWKREEATSAVASSPSTIDSRSVVRTFDS